MNSKVGGFDVILGNPPFINAIEGSHQDMIKPLIRLLHPRLGGTADLGYVFLDHSVDILRRRGRIGLIQPRAVLNATPVQGLRASLNGMLRPNMIFPSNRSDLFPGAAVFVTALVIGPEVTCQVGSGDDPEHVTWCQGEVTNDNWWAEATRILSGQSPHSAQDGIPLNSLFEVAASMTTGDAYDVKPHIADSEQPPGQKLCTTGLIDPDVCLWGKVACRYLKDDYQYPRVIDSPELSKSLRKRLAKSRRPKLLVAGLSKIPECFVDAMGDFIGAVSTYSVYHPKDDVAALTVLCRHMLSEDVQVRFRAELGGNAMGGGNTTMKKGFLEDLPLPASLFA